ncbi:uncharacterized protein C8A04DRAFT_27419 [Dichotomopilus funicola]|uniref:Uncharacterized protein n=1 Tax=Dichotomopilus funicola TaxID=1934379 RepID=A0AAN6ZMN1_9PEZI|nr:hypothetical protein C8A04DRAFT_27419 [Dichotomopilus funicola]
MGLIDDAASAISARTSQSQSHSKRSKSHRSSRHHVKDRSRSNSRSPSRHHRSSRSHVGSTHSHSRGVVVGDGYFEREPHRESHRDREGHRERERSRHRSRSRGGASIIGAAGVGGTLSGIAASIFGGGGDDDDDIDGLAYHDDGRGSHRRPSYERRGSERERERSRGGGEWERERERGGGGGGGDWEESVRGFFTMPSVSRGFFSNFGGKPRHSTSSHRRPRPGFISRLIRKLRRLFRDLLYYAKRHPMKVFALVLMPLITGGALTALLARLGLRLPPMLERALHTLARMAGAGAGAGAVGESLGLVGEAVRMVSNATAGGGVGAARASVERGRDGGMRWERRSLERDFDGLGYGSGSGEWGDGLKKVVKMFS